MRNSTNKIIDAAYPLFMEYGYKKTTTSDIAKAAGINESTLFRNFKSKENLFQKSIDYYAEKAIEVDFNILNYTGDLSTDIKRMVQSMYFVSLELIPLFRLLIKQSLVPEEILHAIDDDIIKQKNLFIHYINGMISRNLIKELNSEVIYDLIYSKVFVSSFKFLTIGDKSENNYNTSLETEIVEVTKYFVKILKIEVN